MKIFNKLVLISLISTMSPLALADINGQVEVKLNVSKGCTVKGSDVEGNVNKFGTLDFGKSSAKWSNVLNAELIGNSGTGTITVSCDDDATPFTVQVDGGLRGDRTLKHAAEEDTVAYTIYRDAARSNAYVINTAQKFETAKDKPTPVPMYGSIAPNTTGVATGDYEDTLLVNVSF